MSLLLDTLQGVDLLSDLDRDAVRRFMVLGGCADHRKGHVFWRSGSEPQGIVVPLSGEAKSTTRDEEGREFVDSLRGPGEILGMTAAVDGLPHASDAVVTRTGEFFAIRQAEFNQFIDEHPAAREAAIRLMGRQLRRHLVEREDMALRPVQERLARFLIENACVKQSDGAKVLVDATQSDIAARLGSVREVVARVLGEFTRDGLLERTSGGLFIHDWNGLRSIARLPENGDSSAVSRYGPSAATRTARFFLPTTESRHPSPRRDANACVDHQEDIDACRRSGCPGAAEL